MVDVVIAQTGFDGQTVTLDVEDEGRIVSTQQVTLPDDGAPATVPVRFTVDEAGPRVLRFRVPPQAGELVTENNAREALIDVRDRRGEDSLLRGRAALRAEVHPPRGDRRREPRASSRCSAPPTTSTCASASTTPTSWWRASRRRARSCSRIAALDSRQHRSRRVHRRSAADDRRVRRSPRRRPADARRAARLLRRRLCRHRGRRRAAGGARSATCAQPNGDRDRGCTVKPTRAGAGQRRHADRRAPKRPRRSGGARCPASRR